jgi:hypothetical protein
MLFLKERERTARPAAAMYPHTTPKTRKKVKNNKEPINPIDPPKHRF